MGAYIYGVLQKKITVTGYGYNEDVYLCKYQLKPWWGWERERPIYKARLAKIDMAWEGKATPRLITVGDKIQDAQEVFDISKRHGGFMSTFYDDPWGFGEIVGWLNKQGREWKVVKTACHNITKGIGNGEMGVYQRQEWVDEHGKYHTYDLFVKECSQKDLTIS